MNKNVKINEEKSNFCAKNRNLTAKMLVKVSKREFPCTQGLWSMLESTLQERGFSGK